jgi:hypothetical protein
MLALTAACYYLTALQIYLQKIACVWSSLPDQTASHEVACTEKQSCYTMFKADLLPRLAMLERSSLQRGFPFGISIAMLEVPSEN